MPGDATTESIVPAEAASSGQIIAKQPGVVAGLDVAAATFLLVDRRWVHAPCRRGCTREDRQYWPPWPARPAPCSPPNALRSTSGAHVGHRHPDPALRGRVAGTRAIILDTRKTAPGLRRSRNWPCARRRTQSPHRPLRHGAHQGQSPRFAGSRRRRRGPRRDNTKLKVEVEARTMEEVQAALELRRGPHPARQHDLR